MNQEGDVSMKTTGLMVLAFCASAAAQGLGTSEVKRIQEAAAVLKEIRRFFIV